MAKVKGPLYSFGASGAIGKTLVYFGWKGIDVVREYVVPVNPKSTKQLAQRALLTAAVLEWHAAAYDDDDMTAWKLYASTFPTPRTGFNAMVMAHLMGALGGGTWVRMHNVGLESPISGEVTVTCETKEDAMVNIGLYHGYSKSSQLNYVYCDGIVAGVATFTIPALTAGKEVYLYISGARVDYKDKRYWEGRTGIYHYTAKGA